MIKWLLRILGLALADQARCSCCRASYPLDEDYLEMIPEIGGEYYCYDCLDSIYWQLPSSTGIMNPSIVSELGNNKKERS